MTSDGSPVTRFRRSIEVRSVNQAEMAMREMDRVGLLDALDYCVLLAAEAPDRYDPAASLARPALGRVRVADSR
jgi:hypothetical protein